jgi:hypothetical protein
MLFSYRYVPHTIDTFQVWLDHLVKEVWCKATGDFSLNLLHHELRVVLEEIFYDDKITKDHLDGPIRKIYELFKTQLTADQRLQVSAWYDYNNDIEALCAGDPAKPPATYADIGNINADLEAELKTFCKSLYADVIGLKAVTSRNGKIDAHFNAFVTNNQTGKCPYCGYSDIHTPRREAYDHFLPKWKYPFNSVNFRNLSPMCQKCNSSYKLQKDPIRRADGTRRKAFYSYAPANPAINISLNLNTQDVANLTAAEIDLQLTAPGCDEEVEAWREVFGIDERYKAKCCSKSDGKAWLQHIIEECDNYGQSPDDLLAQAFRAADRSPYDGANFLRKPFLIACKAANII